MTEVRVETPEEAREFNRIQSAEDAVATPTLEDIARVAYQNNINVDITMKDNINPDHYKHGGIETIEYMKAKSTTEEFHGHLRLTAMKYLSRYGHKDNTLQELKKAKWYLDKLIEELENK